MQERNHQKLYFREIVWLYTKYQFITKSILFFVVFPLFQLILKWLITSTGRVSVSSGDYLPFLFSVQGVGMLVVVLIVLTLLVGIDINAFVILSALIKENKIKIKATQLLITSLKSLKSLCKLSGIFVMLYIAIIIPLVGIGISISVTENFKIPNFITDVIFNNNLYTTIYISILIVFTIITVLFIFFFHYLIIDDRNIKQSLTMSFKLIKKHWKAFIKKFLLQTTLVYISVMFVVVMLFYFMLYCSQNINDLFFRRATSIFLSISLAEIFGYIGMMTAPIICWRLTELFYAFNEKDGNVIQLKQHIIIENEIPKKVKRTKIFVFGSILILFVLNFGVALLLSTFFDEVFKPTRNISIIAHRGGGDLAAENSIKGMEEAIKHGAK